MVVNGRPLKRAKQRVTADLYDFLRFPESAADLDGPFRCNVGAFLSLYARLPPPSPSLPSSILSPPETAGHLMTWRVAFRVGDGEASPEGEVVELEVFEEDVQRARSVYCDQCRVVGWSGHPVCGSRYHFIIRNNCNVAPPCQRACMRCGTMLLLSDSRCVSCNYELTANDIEDWAYLQLEDPTHLLHGVVHTNGYGHLLRVNGREGGSKFLTGCDIMSFWDRLCKMLRVRKVTVMDISKKHRMEYRLLHAVTTGRPWYGDWGYEFGAGSFALTSEAYHKAVNKLSLTPLSLLFSHTRSPRTLLNDKITLYQSLSCHKLVTVRDLFCFVTDLIHDSHKLMQKGKQQQPVENYSSSGVLCAWTRRDVEMAEDAIVKILRAVDRSRWVTWRALRGAAWRAVASPELLDYCLEGIAGKSVDGSSVVAVRCNADNSTVEYRLEAAPIQPLQQQQFNSKPSADQLICDLKFLYDSLLFPSTMHPYRPQSARNSSLHSATKLLDCKQFVKHYDKQEPAPTLAAGSLHLWCQVEPPVDELAVPPPELVVVPETATVAEFLFHASKALRETYLVFRRFRVERILGFPCTTISTPVKLLVGVGDGGGVVRVRGSFYEDERKLWRFRMERGVDKWVVDCVCGAKDDDGERMMACDVCGVWQHTRCAGIGDHEDVPAIFVCVKCAAVVARKPRPRKRVLRQEDNGGSYRGQCKDEILPLSSSSSSSTPTVVGICRVRVM